MRLSFPIYILLVVFLYKGAGTVHAQASATDSLITILEKTKPDTEKVNLYRKVTWDLAFYDAPRSLVYGLNGLKLAQRLKWDKGTANMYHTLGTVYEIMGRYNDGLDVNKKAMVLRKKIHDTLGIGKSYGNLANIFYAQGDIHGALENYLLSTQMFEAIHEERMLATTWINMGVIYQNLADYPTSLTYLLKGLAVAERNHYKEEISYAQSNLGVTYAGLGEYEKSAKSHQASLEIDRKAGNLVGMATGFNNLGNTFFHLGKNAEALNYLKEAYLLFKQQNNFPGMASVMFDEAMILAQEGKTDAAIEKQLQVLEIRLTDTGFIRPSAESYITLSGLYLEKNQKKKALDYATKGLVYAERAGDNNIYLTALRAKATALQQTGNGLEASRLLTLYISMKDSLFTQDRANQLTRKEIEFSFERDKLADSLSNAAETKRKDLELEKQDAQLSHERMIRYFLFVLALLLVVVGYFIYRAYRNKQKDNELIVLQKKEVEMQKAIVDTKNKEILDSIQYAKKIQYALLANTALMQENMPEHFVFFQPKDVVSGDFYWAAKKFENLKQNGSNEIKSSNAQQHSNDQIFFLAVCDSTGHGVPGAFMSLLNTSFLNEAVMERDLREPAKVFHHVRHQLISNMAHEGQKDGMDGILLRIDLSDRKLPIQYAAANNAPIVIRHGEVMELPYDKIPVGDSHHLQDFNAYNYIPVKGDMLYLFTDGYADQFGGEKGKKFKYKNLHQLLLTLQPLSMQEQEKKLAHHFNQWKGDLEQVDDVCVIGIRL